MNAIKLINLIVKEYFAIVEYVTKKIPATDNKIVINSSAFYALLDKNLYIKRNEKLEIYKTLNFIICNSNGLTSVVYDKETKKTSRKIIFDYMTYKTLKSLYEIDFKEQEE